MTERYLVVRNLSFILRDEYRSTGNQLLLSHNIGFSSPRLALECARAMGRSGEVFIEKKGEPATQKRILNSPLLEPVSPSVGTRIYEYSNE